MESVPSAQDLVRCPHSGSTQVVNLLFHNFPDQKIVLVAHSNQALNDLFEKIVALDIPERYLLRLGRGIEAPPRSQPRRKTDHGVFAHVMVVNCASGT